MGPDPRKCRLKTADYWAYLRIAATVLTTRSAKMGVFRGVQSVKTTESGGISGFDAGKKVKGRKLHILTDTGGHQTRSKTRYRQTHSLTRSAVPHHGRFRLR